MRKLVLVLAVLIVLVLSTGGFAFQNEPEGFRGLKWGDPPTEDMELIGEEYVYDVSSEGGEYISRDDVVKRRRELSRLALSNEAWEKYTQDMPSFCQYKRKNDELKIGEAKLKYIYYKFYKKQFMNVEIGVDGDYVDVLRDTLELKFGQGEHIKRSSFRDPWFRYAQKGHIAGIALIEFFDENYEREKTLIIYSTKISTQKKEDEDHQVEEEKRKVQEEKQKVAEKGLDDF